MNTSRWCSSTNTSFARHNKKSTLTNKNAEGKISMVEGIVDKAHIWWDGGHSKKKWLMVSSSAPHHKHPVSRPMCL